MDGTCSMKGGEEDLVGGKTREKEATRETKTYVGG
jgi:hypothetical protein